MWQKSNSIAIIINKQLSSPWVTPLTPLQFTHTNTETHMLFPHAPPLQLRYTLLTPPTAHHSRSIVARQHAPCMDTHLPSGFSALNLVLIVNWVGEQADAGWMRSRLWLWPLKRLRYHEVTQTQSGDAQQSWAVHNGRHETCCWGGNGKAEVKGQVLEGRKKILWKNILIPLN